MNTLAAKGNGVDTRIAILSIIEQSKAIHKSELCRQVDKSWGTVGYHLKLLKSEGLIKTGQHDGLLWAYTDRLNRRQRKQARLLAEENARMIMTAVDEQPGITVNELDSRLDMTIKAIRRHLGRMTDAGILKREGLRPQRFWVKRKEA